MKMPTSYDDDILGFENPMSPASRSEAYSLIYPPIGFFPFYSIGNGDYHGFYWANGREEGPPIVAFTSHDVGSLIPEHTDIEALYRCKLATTKCEDNAETYRTLAFRATAKPPSEHAIRAVDPCDFVTLLTLDPRSPFLLCAAADKALAMNDLNSAEQFYRHSLDELPEYVAPHFGLASLLRRQRRNAEAIIHLRQALIGPSAFYGGSFWSDTCLPGTFRNDWHRKALLWLQQATAHGATADDPFVASVSTLTFKNGLADNPDFKILFNVVEQYEAMGEYSEASQIWRLIGEMASRETTSFRERLALSPRTYGTRLASLLERSGNELRSMLVRNMLAAMDKPNGLYL